MLFPFLRDYFITTSSTATLRLTNQIFGVGSVWLYALGKQLKKKLD